MSFTFLFFLLNLVLADTISNLIHEVKASLESEQPSRTFEAEYDDVLFNYTAQTFISQQQLESINGCAFVFPGNMDFTTEDISTFSLDTADD